MPMSLPFVTAFTKTDLTAMLGCIGVVMVCPVSGTTTPGTFSQMRLAPSIEMGPLIIFACIAPRRLPPNRACPPDRPTPTASRVHRAPHPTGQLHERLVHIAMRPPPSHDN